MSKLPLWSLFMQTVEARPAPASVVMRGGKPGFSGQPIPKGSAPNPGPLIDLLRSGEPIPPEVREWLADLLDDEGDSALRLKFARRRSGAPSGDGTENWPAAALFERLVEEGQTRQRALHLAGERFGLKRSALEASIASRAAALEEYRAASQEPLIANDDEA